jgi:hypothetical protein
MTLKVEGVVNRTVHAEEALSGSSRLEPLQLTLASQGLRKNNRAENSHQAVRRRVLGVERIECRHTINNDEPANVDCSFINSSSPKALMR